MEANGAELQQNLNMGRMKTYRGWQKSDKELGEYLVPGDRIDEDMYNYLAELVPPVFCFDGFVQCGDCDHETEGTRFHMTASYDGEIYRYLGILPRFSDD